MRTLALLCILFFALDFHGQIKDTLIKKRYNAVMLNISGENIFGGGSITFEKSLLNKKYVRMGFGAGVGHTWGLYHEVYCFPTYLNFKLGKRKHFLEFNGGINHLVDFNPYPKTKAQRDEFRKNPPYNTDSLRPAYVPCYFINLNYMYMGARGLVFKIGCAASNADIELPYSPYYFILPRLSIGYAF